MSVGVILPQAVSGTAAGWTLTDFANPPQLVSAPAAGGTCRVALGALDLNERWSIDHAVVACSSPTPTTVRWYADVADAAHLLDGSNSGNFDVADWPSGLQIPPGTSLLVVWSGAAAGAIGTVTLQGRVYRRGT
ncbi:MAG TPA: hypothetical protein VGC04_11220 [Cellulomonas sp.]